MKLLQRSLPFGPQNPDGTLMKELNLSVLILGCCKFNSTKYKAKKKTNPHFSTNIFIESLLYKYQMSHLDIWDGNIRKS